MRQTRTLTFEKYYDPKEDQCIFFAEEAEAEPLEASDVAQQIKDYLEQMCDNHCKAKISVSFREEV
jgi:hypothetical protein